MDAAATLADLDGLPADGLAELDELAYALPTVDTLNIGLAGTYAAIMRSTTREPNAGPRTSGRRRKPSVLVHQVSIDDLEPERVVRPAYETSVELFPEPHFPIIAERWCVVGNTACSHCTYCFKDGFQ